MWIDASDEVPTEVQEVLVYSQEDGYSVGYHIGGKWSVLGHGDNQPVTHWQPLPSAPSERKPSDQPKARSCCTCENWGRYYNSGMPEVGECLNSRSPKFTDLTASLDGCTPNKKAKMELVEDEKETEMD